MSSPHRHTRKQPCTIALGQCLARLEIALEKRQGDRARRIMDVYLRDEEVQITSRSPLIRLDGLSDRLLELLNDEGIRRVGHLLRCTAFDLLSIAQLGSVHLEDIRESLKKHGLRLKGDLPQNGE